MYAAHFGLRDNPFAITPDPSYLYLSPHHQEALAHLLYGIEESGGFVQLTGEVGTGKTTLVRTLVEQHLANVDIALCLNPRLTVEELVATICDELRVNYPRTGCTLKTLVDALNAHLLQTHAQGRHTVLIIDEAQQLSREVLEQVRLLTNLETHRHKLLRILLVGQPELQTLLAQQNLRQLAQRITARYHLLPLNRAETIAYVNHRLRVAGGNETLFTPSALRTLYRLTGGIPRLINVICDRALLGAYSKGCQQVTAALLRQAAHEALRGPPAPPPRPQRRLALEAALLASLLLAAGTVHWSRLQPVLADWLPTGTTTVTQPTPSPATPTPPVVPVTAPVRAVVPPPVAPVVPVAAVTPVTPVAPPAPIPSTVSQASPSPPSPPLESVLFKPGNDLDALPRLLAVWGEQTVFPPAVAPCEHIKSLRLRCLNVQGGNWEELRRYNRPALLQLKAPTGEARQVLLRALDGDHATLDVEGQPVAATVAQLSAWWTGDYLLLWRFATDLDLIGPGSSGDAVVWLRERLAQIEGQPSLPPERLPAVFDPALKERVRNFQRANALQADGLVGQRTMALLTSLEPAPGTPVLAPATTPKVN